MTQTLARPERQAPTVLFSSGLWGFKPKYTFQKADDGKVVWVQVVDMPVFRSGSFADSMGYMHTWEPIHIEQMVTNFNYLKDNGTFPKVPVRRGHGGLFADPMDSLIGWHESVRSEEMVSPIDGETHTYLLATYSIFDEPAAQHVSEDNWPNRSAEIGMYVTNSEAEFYPAYMGFAYVDIPAVEGLNFAKHQKETGAQFSLLISDPKEFGVTAPAATSQGVPTPPATPAPAAPAAPAAVPAAPAATEQHQAPVAPVAPAPVAPAAAHSFSIAGRATTDFAAVQAHIVNLESFQRETLEAGRTNFVSSLAAGAAPKIVASQVESLTELALSMDDAQFSKFKKSYEDAPANALFAAHGQPNSSGDSNGGTVDATADRINVLKETVSRHRMGGVMTEEQLQKTNSYKELKSLDPTFS